MSAADPVVEGDSWSFGSLWACGGAGLFLDPLGVVDCSAEIETIRAPFYATLESGAGLLGSLFVGSTEAAISGAAGGLASPPGGSWSPTTIVALGVIGAVAGAGVASALGERPVSGAIWGGAVGLAWGAFSAARSVFG